MNTKHILEDIETTKNPAALDTLIKYIGNRTPEELRIIIGMKRKAFAFLAEKTGEKNADTELLAFYAAAAALRRHRPHSAKVMALIDKQREERKARRPRYGYGIRGRIESDFEDITAFLAAGYSWTEIVDTLKRRSTKYRGMPLKPDTFRKTYRRIESERAAAGACPVSAQESEDVSSCIHAEPIPEPAPEPVFPERLEPLEPVGPVETPLLPLPLG